MRRNFWIQIQHYKKYILAAAFWLVLWQAAAMAVDKPLLLPSVSMTAKRLMEFAATAEYWRAVFVSLGRIFSGILAALLLGLFGGILAGAFPWFSVLFSPFLAVLRATPVASFIVLLVLWMKRDTIPALVSAITVFPMIWAGAEEGIKNVDSNLKEMTQVFRIYGLRRIRFLYIPTLRPYLAASLKGALGLAWKSAVAAEVITLPMVSIGRRMYYASNNLDTAGTFAWTITVILLSILVNAGLARLVLLLNQTSGERSRVRRSKDRFAVSKGGKME